jgi:hypothetical protein
MKKMGQAFAVAHCNKLPEGIIWGFVGDHNVEPHRLYLKANLIGHTSRSVCSRWKKSMYCFSVVNTLEIPL